MKQQLLLAIGREFGSGGHEIARKLAERFGARLYDEAILSALAQERQWNEEKLKQYDEVPRKVIFSRVVNGYNNAPENIISQMTFDYIRERAERGESFVILGRCGIEILKEYPRLISIFVQADESFKLKRTMECEPMSEHEALALMVKTDRRRASYHNQYCQKKWGCIDSYDLCINSAKLGVEGTSDVLEQYIRARLAAETQSE